MTDFVTYQKQDGDGDKASYSFGFTLDINGVETNVNIDVLSGEAADEMEAFEIAKQKAADAKQRFVDEALAVDHRGPVQLPQARKTPN